MSTHSVMDDFEYDENEEGGQRTILTHAGFLFIKCGCSFGL